MYERPYLKLVTSRIEEPRKFIQVILGPRQVGKTTMITQLLSQLSIPNLYESADAIPYDEFLKINPKELFLL